jgi:hypothetical protein
VTEHKAGPLVRRRYGRGVRTRCSCGKLVTSTGNDTTLWRAFDKHVQRANDKEREAALGCTGDPRYDKESK